MDKKTISISLVMLAIGVAIGYFVAPTPKANNDPSATEPKRRAKAHVSDVGEQARVESLRRRIRELEKENA